MYVNTNGVSNMSSIIFAKLIGVIYFENYLILLSE